MRPEPPRAGTGGFSLLEVLAAVALLGVLYTVLAGVAMTWLGREGEARRRLEASLRADRALAEIEAQVAQGTVPPPGRFEEVDHPFTVTTAVQALVLPLQLFEQEGFERDPGAPTLFPQQSGAESPLRRIDVVVSWEEATGLRSALRSTVALDLLEAAPILALIPGAGGAR